MIQRPNAVGLILCQQGVVDEITGNVTLVNCFNRLTFRDFPTPPRQFMVYAVLTDGLGEMDLSVTVEGLDELTVRQRVSWHETFADPLRELRRLVRITECSFPSPGRYQVSLLAEGEWVAQCVLTLSRTEE
jgi:hypothetical protein